MSEAKQTKNHETIRRWVEERGGHPATVRGTENDHQPGVLRIDFDGQEPDLDRIDWDSFFQKFDEKDLLFLYQEQTEEGKTSRFCKFIDPQEA